MTLMFRLGRSFRWAYGPVTDAVALIKWLGAVAALVGLVGLVLLVPIILCLLLFVGLQGMPPTTILLLGILFLICCR